jgi:leucyl-tRNA synthetase
MQQVRSTLVEESKYQPGPIETKWQKHWEEKNLFRAGERTGAPPAYVLEMFPYPSGAMHMGHVRVYTLGDVIARQLRMKGHDVLHPMGYDSFGLPAENAAIKDGIHPAVRTPKNIESFREDLKSLGVSYDWSREIATHEPRYYKWNQWFFLRMLERGIVYRRTSRVNWCPVCNTVLANEQVIEGLCWRCDNKVEDRRIPEWAFRTTAYADELLSDIDAKLTEWPERIRALQRNWIGKSEGAQVEFPVESSDVKITVFTTRVDTIFGCTYVVIAPEHKLVKEFVKDSAKLAEIEAFSERIAAARKLDRAADTKKEGLFTGAYAKNPFTGERVPIWVANFVVADYGTGAVMSVPAHDERDFEFAKQYGLPIKAVIAPADGSAAMDSATAETAYTEDGVLFDSGPYSGTPSAEARKQMTTDAANGGFGKRTIQYKWRDWGFSRQRYWGTPIPIVYCEKCDPERKGIPVPDDQLPVRLPSENEMDLKHVLSGEGEPPLAKIPSFINTTCPKCSGPARREAETMDTFVDSSWYFARYLAPNDDRAPFSRAEAEKWLPVGTYIGGPEHAVMHLLYFRFWTKVMNELGLCSTREPAKRLVTQGIVNGADGRKMSKRFKNGVSPTEMVSKYGADVIRLFILFASPPQDDMKWSDEQVEGSWRFVNRIWRQLTGALPELASVQVSAANDAQSGTPAHELRKKTHKTIKKFTRDIDNLQFNTCVSNLMELSNTINDTKFDGTPATAGAVREALESFALLLSPLAPHLAAEMWSRLGRTEELQTYSWPTWDESLTIDDLVTYAVQVNGKLRGEMQVALTASEDEIKAAALALDKVKAQTEGKSIKKAVVVKGRLVNFVVA